MIMKNASKVIILIIVMAAILTLGYKFMNKEQMTSQDKGFTISSKETMKVKSEGKYEKIYFKYFTESKDGATISIYNPIGKLVESQEISDVKSYSKEFENIEGEWRVELTPKENKEATIQSTVTKTKN